MRIYIESLYFNLMQKPLAPNIISEADMTQDECQEMYNVSIGKAIFLIFSGLDPVIQNTTFRFFNLMYVFKTI